VISSGVSSWILVSDHHGVVEKDKRIWVSIDWKMIPKGRISSFITIKGTGKEVIVYIDALNPTEVTKETLKGFVESEGVVSIEAEHFTRKVDKEDRKWMRVQDYGHTLSGMRTYGPANTLPGIPGKDAPCLEYRLYLFTVGSMDIKAMLGSTLNFMPGRSVQFAVSFDNDSCQIVTMIPEKYSAKNGNKDWEKSVEDNARFTHTIYTVPKPGYHILKVWMIDPGIILQKIVLDLGGMKPSYLGPPESFYKTLLQ